MHEVLEQKVTFMNGLRFEWKAIVSTMKNHEQLKKFKSYPLANLVGILRSQKDEVKKDVKLVSSMGSLVLVVNCKKIAKKGSESDFAYSELTKEEYALLVSNAKKFVKKNFRQE